MVYQINGTDVSAAAAFVAVAAFVAAAAFVAVAAAAAAAAVDAQASLEAFFRQLFFASPLFSFF